MLSYSDCCLEFRRGQGKHFDLWAAVQFCSRAESDETRFSATVSFGRGSHLGYSSPYEKPTNPSNRPSQLLTLDNEPPNAQQRSHYDCHDTNN